MTPGPWRVSDKHGLCVVTEAGALVADICDMTLPPDDRMWTGTREDANLIAAAPDLLEACKAVMAGYGGEPLSMKELAMMRAAIAKAEGRR